MTNDIALAGPFKGLAVKDVTEMRVLTDQRLSDWKKIKKTVLPITVLTEGTLYLLDSDEFQDAYASNLKREIRNPADWPRQFLNGLFSKRFIACSYWGQTG